MAMTREEQARFDQMSKELDTLRSRGTTLSIRVSEKGAISIYGLGRFPVTLYKEQWTSVLNSADEIRAFIAAHDSALSDKSSKVKRLYEAKPKAAATDMANALINALKGVK